MARSRLPLPFAAAALLLLAAWCGTGHAYYVPGTYPQEFWPGDTIQGAFWREKEEGSRAAAGHGAIGICRLVRDARRLRGSPKA